MPQIVQRDDGSLGVSTELPVSSASRDVGHLPVSSEWLATSVSKRFFTAGRPYRVKGINPTVTVAGTDAGAVTAVINKVPSGTAVGSGTTLHSGTINLKGTADTKQVLTLSTTAGVLDLAAGDSLAIVFTGVLTLATGDVTVELDPK